MVPPPPCAKCKLDIADDSEKFDCDLCCISYHATCDKVKKTDLAARKKSTRLRLYCNDCSVKKLEVANAEKLSILYKYIVKIDSQTQEQVVKQTNTDEKMTQVFAMATETKQTIENIKNNIDTKSQSNDGKKKSYANVLRQNKKPVVLVKPKNDKQLCNKTIEEVKQKISQREIHASGIRNIRNGGIAINCDSNKSTAAIKQIVQSKLGDDYVVSLPPIKKPRVKIVGVCDTYNNDELLIAIKEQNDYLMNANIEVKKILKKTGKDRPYDVVLEIDYDSYTELMKTKFVNLGWRRCKVFDHIHITRCYKCCGFAHISTECKSKNVCPKCGDEHEYKDCKSELLSCANCVNMNKKFNTKYDCDHHALSSKCQTTKSKLLQLSKKIQYTEST